MRGVEQVLDTVGKGGVNAICPCKMREVTIIPPWRRAGRGEGWRVAKMDPDETVLLASLKCLIAAGEASGLLFSRTMNAIAVRIKPPTVIRTLQRPPD